MVPVDRAYMAAGFRSKPEWARPNGSRLAHFPEVAARIGELQDEFRSNAKLHVEYLQSLALPVAEANLADFVTYDGEGGPRFKKLSELTRAQAAAIQAVSFGDDGSIADLKLAPKIDAVKTLMASIGATGVQRHEHTVAPVGQAIFDGLNVEEQLQLKEALRLIKHQEPADQEQQSESEALNVVFADGVTAADHSGGAS